MSYCFVFKMTPDSWETSIGYINKLSFKIKSDKI